MTILSTQRLKAALSHHPGAIANGNMNSMGHMMEMMSSRQEQGTHHHMHSHPHQHLQAPPHAYQHHGHHHHNQGHGQGGHHHPQGHNPHHNSHNPHLHPGHPHQTSPHPPMHSASQVSNALLWESRSFQTARRQSHKFNNTLTTLHIKTSHIARGHVPWLKQGSALVAL